MGIVRHPQLLHPMFVSIVDMVYVLIMMVVMFGHPEE